MAIPVMLKEAEGEMTDGALQAIKFEKIRAEEEIEGLRKFYHEGIISHVQMEVAIAEVKERIEQLLIEIDILT